MAGSMLMYDPTFFGRGKPLFVEADFSLAQWNTAGFHGVFHVVGSCEVDIIAVCTLALNNAGTISLGITTSPATFIALTNNTAITANTFWFSIAPANNTAPGSVALTRELNNVTIGHTCVATVPSAGKIQYVCRWRPNTPGSYVAPLAGA